LGSFSFAAKNYSEKAARTTDCPEVIMQQNFDQPNLLIQDTGFTAGMGASAKILKGSHDDSNMLAVRNRYQVWQGPTFDVTRNSTCLSSDTFILFSAKVKLLPHGTSPGATFSRSSCKSVCCKMGSGAGCPTLKVSYMTQDGKLTRRPLVLTDPHDIEYDGMWYPLMGTFKLSPLMLDPTNLYIAFSIAGVEKLIDIYIDDIEMKHAPLGSYVKAARPCFNLTFGGDAELLPVLPYPMYSFISDTTGELPTGGLLRTVNDPTFSSENNHVFQLVGRSEMYHGLAFSFPPDCVLPGNMYYFSARVFLNNTLTDYSGSARNPDAPIVMLKKQSKNQTTFTPITTCPAANASIGWVQCKGFYTFKEGDNTVDSLQVSFMMMTDKTSEVLYDDISFTYTNVGTGTPIFNHHVGKCWGVGASVYMASQGINVTADSILTVLNKNVTADNTTIRFNETADAIPLSRNMDFATEFALLSRNIHFESEDLTNPANGATMTILSTPMIPQLLQGVSFKGFGQQGLADRYVSSIHSICFVVLRTKLCM
jgi:hypothetical protein